MNNSAIDLKVKIASVEFSNPVITASGTFGYGEEFSKYCNLDKIGGFVTKGLSLKPRAGNRTPRIVETAGGMLNAIGLQNVGVDAFIDKKMPFIKTLSTKAIANFFGNTVEEYAEMACRLGEINELSALEINISCPNVKHGGIVFGTDPQSAATVVAACRKATSKPLFVKLSPNVTDIVCMAKACEDAGADALSLINTLTGMAIDLKKRKPLLANITGGFSGPAIKPIALRMVWQVAKAVKLPIIGIGGIMTAEDALEFILAGATAVQVGTASFINPSAAEDIAVGIENWLKENGVKSIKDLIGALES